MVEEKYTLKDLRYATNAPAYVILYLKDCDRLPIVQESQGRGYPTLYHPDSIQIVKDHLKKQRFND
jgi:hypothetical protein